VLGLFRESGREFGVGENLRESFDLRMNEWWRVYYIGVGNPN